jgi:hypothetical protein
MTHALIDEISRMIDKQAVQPRWERRAFRERLVRLQDEARRRFAEARGWKRIGGRFHIDGLVRGLRHSRCGNASGSRRGRDIDVALGRPWFDHVEYYKSLDGVCAAIVSHTYLYGDHGCENLALAQRAVDFAARIGLACEVIPAAQSWYYPDHTTMLVFSRPGPMVTQ